MTEAELALRVSEIMQACRAVEAEARPPGEDNRRAALGARGWAYFVALGEIADLLEIEGPT